MTDVDDVGVGAQELGDFLDGLDGGREADALGTDSDLGRKRVQAGQRERQVRAALIVGDGVNFIDDHGAGGPQHGSGFLGGQQDVERFGRGDEDVRAMLTHLLAFVGGGIAGADGSAYGIELDALARGELGDFGQRYFEVLVDVVAQSFEGRDVDDLGLVGKLAGAGGTNQAVQADEESGECFSGTGGRRNQDVAAGSDLRPSENLRFGGGGETGSEPLGDERVEIREYRRKTGGVRLGLGIHLPLF